MGICVPIQGGFITLSKTDFKCPYCKTQYNDNDDKYLKRCNTNKSHCTSIKCGCDETFGMTYDMTGNAVTFKKQ